MPTFIIRYADMTAALVRVESEAELNRRLEEEQEADGRVCVCYRRYEGDFGVEFRVPCSEEEENGQAVLKFDPDWPSGTRPELLECSGFHWQEHGEALRLEIESLFPEGSAALAALDARVQAMPLGPIGALDRTGKSVSVDVDSLLDRAAAQTEKAYRDGRDRVYEAVAKDHRDGLKAISDAVGDADPENPAD
jgi:hypothetical protein